jgi:hypothetical protein
MKNGGKQNMSIRAIKYVRQMPDGECSQLMLGDDRNQYVVNLQASPQHRMEFAREILATRLATAVGLSVSKYKVINVDSELTAKIRALKVKKGTFDESYSSGPQLGSLLENRTNHEEQVEYLPGKMLLRVANLNEFAGMLAFDKWICNLGPRRAVFSKGRDEDTYWATFIDHGRCFSVNPWDVLYGAGRGGYRSKSVYRNVAGWESFEPWLGRIEKLDPQIIWEAAHEIPAEWWAFDRDILDLLVDDLVVRRQRIKRLITDFAVATHDRSMAWTNKFLHNVKPAGANNAERVA